MAGATTTTPYLVSGPQSGSTGTAAAVAAIVVIAALGVAAVAYAASTLRRGAAMAPALKLAPSSDEAEERRKAA